MNLGRLEARRQASQPAALTAVGSVGLALTGVLFSGIAPAHPASVAHTRTRPPGAAPSPAASASPTVTAPPTVTVPPTGTSPATSDSDRSWPGHHYGPVAPTCEVRSVYRIKTNRARSLWIPGTHFVDGPGGEMKALVEKEHWVEAEVLLEKEAELTFDFDTFVAEVRKMVSPLIRKKNKVFVGHEFVHPINKRMYGHMRYRVFGYRIGFWQYRQYGNCGIRFIGSGVANIPTNKQGWKYWETKIP